MAIYEAKKLHLQKNLRVSHDKLVPRAPSSVLFHTDNDDNDDEIYNFDGACDDDLNPNYSYSPFSLIHVSNESVNYGRGCSWGKIERIDFRAFAKQSIHWPIIDNTHDREGEGDGVFVVLVKPLFEALGEQSRQVQSGSALCLARIIDNTHDPPISILQRMLTRTSKLLKNPHFMAKPAVIELNRSIIQAGGAPSQDILSATMTSIREALKSSDWPTRKAASIALGEIASSGVAFMGSCKASCIRSLELCHFDKVKPVRDTVLQALQYWRTLPGADTPEPLQKLDLHLKVRLSLSLSVPHYVYIFI